MRQRLLPVLFLTTLLGCSKSDSNPIVDFGEGEGITYRTANNLPIGPRDYSDWTSDDQWNNRERALFPDLGFDLNGAQQPATIINNTVYPNPAMGPQATWSFQTQRLSSGAVTFKVQAVLVDRNYRVLTRIGPQDFVLGLNFQLNYAALGVSPNELYRLYYVVYNVANSSQLVYKGHGDIRYSPQ
jgi:hypothetical protein